MEGIHLDTNKYNKVIEMAENRLNQTFPSIIEIQTMSFCNANCIVCPYRSMDLKQTRMSDERLKKILDEISSHKDSVKRVIPYLNNEPSFDNRLLDILRTIKSLGIETEISTNISNFKVEDLKTIVDEKLIDDFRISFFGDTKEIYQKLMPGLHYEENVSKVKELLEYNEKMGNVIPIELIVVLLPELDALGIIKGLEELFHYKKIHPFGFLDRCGKVEIAKNKKMNDNQKYVIKGCALNRPYERCCIYSDGNVVLCSQDWGKEVIIGNVFEQSIEEIWNSEKAKEIRNIILGKKTCPKDFLCTRCKLAIIEKDEQLVQNFEGDKYMKNNDEKMLY